MIEFGTILRPNPTSSVREWAEAWAKCYSEAYSSATYESGLDALKMATNDATHQHALISLFEWKNGRSLSRRKRHAVESISYRQWTAWKSKPKVPKHFKSGAIWNIFLAHLLSEGKRPIFDQHTWRACCTLTSIRCEELRKMRSWKRYDAYAEYEKWFKNVVVDVDPRTLDRALMAYGQFLSSQFRPLLELPSYMNADECFNESRKHGE